MVVGWQLMAVLRRRCDGVRDALRDVFDEIL